MVLADELDALLELLEREKIEYALVGALAVAIWGAPRATKDIDLLVQPIDVERIKTAVATIGFTLPAMPMTFSDGMSMQRISKVVDRALITLDLMFVDASLKGAWANRQRIETERGGVWTVTRDALIDMKLRAGRPQDVFDVQRMKDLDR